MPPTSWSKASAKFEEVDLQFADRFGYRIKHLGIGYDRGERVELRVHPALVRKK